jgi:hypothetical protein
MTFPEQRLGRAVQMLDAEVRLAIDDVVGLKSRSIRPMNDVIHLLDAPHADDS